MDGQMDGHGGACLQVFVWGSPQAEDGWEQRLGWRGMLIGVCAGSRQNAAQ